MFEEDENFLLNSQSEWAIKQDYDNQGLPYRDVDMSHHGNMKQYPEAPHEHIWEFDKNANKIGR